MRRGEVEVRAGDARLAGEGRLACVLQIPLLEKQRIASGVTTNAKATAWLRVTVRMFAPESVFLAAKLAPACQQTG
nr:hypothetical protein [Chromobacterium sp. ASV5]